MSNENLSKLPKWASSLIQRLERDKAYLEDRLRNIGSALVAPIKVEISREADTFFPMDCRVIFSIKDGDLMVSIKENGDRIYINKIGIRNDDLIIYPSCSNAVEIS